MTWRDSVRENFPEARFDEPLSRYTTFRIGGPADCFVTPSNAQELARLIGLARGAGVPFFLIGRGSNLLVLDGGVRGIVARLCGDFEKIFFLDSGRVRAGAAVRLPQFVLQCAERGLGGAEPLVGVPGTIGGALAMNAGTREREIGELTTEVSVLDEKDLQPRILKRSEIDFSYRSSSLAGRIIIDGEFQLRAGSKADIIERVQGHQQRRLQTQPVHTFNVGSVFKNPSGHYVAKLIEAAGLKGVARGGARISKVHANFIENTDKATAADVLCLIDLARGEVKRRSGIELELEVKVIGEGIKS
jgi:UDP-N-acetylmuramate dehydrogenase